MYLYFVIISSSNIFSSIKSAIRNFHHYSDPHAHSQNRTILVLYRCYAANFAHMCGGGSIRATLRTKKLPLTCKHDASAFLFSVVLNSYF
ncbi:Hypothetical protein EUBREC_0226 [Agathobacter rectalis ATCC 33656]|uniref:Uncharacterized protein n=1 Tax=Agathobacter rectalis (strain ATCC 33656 / DSM 3377 / JCM 17463 / KCTC 5835 / VPI 0990) TaxID=515619 RepID=C4ZAG9_AGARV|nr:Hypothetical protein EUBREC_0226 [Agathobacter rectalis ATCC 33656]